MTTEHETQTESANMVESTLIEFNRAIKSQEQLNRRSSFMVQFGIIFIIAAAIGAFYMVWSLKTEMQQMNDYIANMSKDVSVMSRSMSTMKSSMGSMEQGIDEVVGYTNSISRAIVQSDNSVAVMTHIANSVGSMQQDFKSLNQNVSSVNYNLNSINKHIQSLNNKLGVMGQDVNRMSSPVKMFPF